VASLYGPVGLVAAAKSSFDLELRAFCLVWRSLEAYGTTVGWLSKRRRLLEPAVRAPGILGACALLGYFALASFHGIG
jgi:hypothetical protein